MRNYRSLVAVLALALAGSSLPAAHAADVKLVAIAWRGGVPVEITRYVSAYDVTTTITAMRQIAGVVAVGQDGVVRTNDTSTPLDPRTNEQWGALRLDVAELTSRGMTGAGVTVAVIDTGVDATHPELKDVVLPGWDAIDPQGDGRKDSNGHGTHVAGIIAAAANSTGGQGLAPGVRILPVRVLGADGSGDDSDVARGVLWAISHGADVINMSLGAPTQNDLLAGAVKEAHNAGVAVIVSAGNDGLLSSPPSYPAANDGAFGVAATDAADKVAYFSTRGSYVKFSAPGVFVLSTWPSGSWQLESGTSMAAPFVSAAVALTISAKSVTPLEAVARLIGSATDIDASGTDSATGAGLIDPLAAATDNQPRLLTDRVKIVAPVNSVLPLPTLNTPSLTPLPLPAIKPFPVPVLPDLPTPGIWQAPTSPGLTLPGTTPTKGGSSTKPKPGRVGSSGVPVILTLTATNSTSGQNVTLRLRAGSSPLTDKTVTITVGSRKKTVRTDALGRARTTMPRGAVSARFSGDRIYGSASGRT